MISEEKLCDTVLDLINIGKTLPPTWDGSDEYESACNDFVNKFRDNRYDELDWERAKAAYIASNVKNITAQNYESFLKDVGAVKQEFSEEEKKYYAIKRRAQQRILASFSRVRNINGDTSKHIPTDEFAVSVGVKHGFTPNELLIPFNRGGQLLSIKAFIIEYECFKEKGIPFLYKMGVDANKEVVWAENKLS